MQCGARHYTKDARKAPKEVHYIEHTVFEQCNLHNGGGGGGGLSLNVYHAGHCTQVCTLSRFMSLLDIFLCFSFFWMLNIHSIN